MDFFFDTSLVLLALAVVLIIAAVTAIILVRDVVRFALRRKRERAAREAAARTAPDKDNLSEEPQPLNR